MIGVGISTHNRYEVFKKTYNEIKKRLPKGAKLIVVDDASLVPCPEADYRFENNVGISVTKNKCLELLDDCDDIFLFDDDTYPLTDDWYKPYIESTEPHLCYIFKDFIARPLNDCKVLYVSPELIAYSHARGCMLYFKHICLETVGGFDERHKRWGGEHIQLSDRIYNVGLTSFRYQDVHSDGLIYSADEHEAVQGTVGRSDRIKYLDETAQLRAESKTTTIYCEYKKPVKHKRKRSERTAVLTSYLTQQLDPQRNIEWEADYSALQPLINSIKDTELIVLSNCLDEPDTKTVKHVKAESWISPYWQRWLNQYWYLKKNPDIGYVFMVDATDVEMLHNPFKELKEGILYVGDEQSTLNNEWLMRQSNMPMLTRYFRQNRNKPLLNCGVVGGDYDTVMEFLHGLTSFYFDSEKMIGETEMGGFNYLLHTKWENRIEYGRHITTRFKADERTDAWFKHK